MRKFVFIAVLVLGALAGLLTAAHDDWGTRIVMMCVGVFFAAPVGAAITFAGSRANTVGDVDQRRREWLTGEGTTADDLVANYGRDKGHPPFMKPTEGLAGKHQFDPDRLG